MLDTPRTLYSVQRRDTSEFWCAGAWGAVPEWIDYERMQEICRTCPELPITLSKRFTESPNDE
jgi:hypothetical protein